MAEMDKIPQKFSIDIETVKVDDEVLKTIKDLNEKLNLLIGQFGQIYIRKKDINQELISLDETLEQAEDEFKAVNTQLKEVIDALDEQYPQGRLNLQDGTVQYQPGAPTRKQLLEQQKQSQQ